MVVHLLTDGATHGGYDLLIGRLALLRLRQLGPFHAASLNELHGQAKESQRFYGYTARRSDVWYVTRYLAFNALRDQGVKVSPHGEH